MEFKLGDTVWLKSGGPVMTIKGTEQGFVLCEWFDKDHKWHEGRFLPTSIENVPEPPEISPPDYFSSMRNS